MGCRVRTYDDEAVTMTYKPVCTPHPWVYRKSTPEEATAFRHTTGASRAHKQRKEGAASTELVQVTRADASSSRPHHKKPGLKTARTTLKYTARAMRECNPSDVRHSVATALAGEPESALRKARLTHTHVTPCDLGECCK